VAALAVVRNARSMAFHFLQYLFIVLPGTIAGEMLLERLSERMSDEGEGMKEVPGSSVLSGLLAVLAFAFIPVNLVGLFTRELWWNLVANLVLIALGYWLLRIHSVKNTAKTLHKKLWNWGIFWLLLGLAFEVFEGGIKKDKSTLSYYALTSGLAFLLLLSLTIFLEEIKLWRGVQAFANAVIASGQNPMIAYVTGGMLLIPLISLTGLQAWYNAAFEGAWLGALRGVLFTALVVVITQFFTRRGIFWRA
jgi:predicted small integral membrane protein